MTNKVREFRRKKGISQQRLAKMCGVSRTTIWKIESGNTDSVMSSTLFSIAKSLDATMAEIFLA